MVKKAQKRLNAKDRIYVLVPTRNRTAGLQKLFLSLRTTISRPELVNVWVYIDNDDRESISFMERLDRGEYNFGIHTIISERCINGDEMFIRLADACKADTGIYMYCGDKAPFKTAGWDEEVRRTYDGYRDRVLISFPSYPYDYMNSANFPFYAFLSAQWIKLCGGIHTDYFPFWFDDAWVDEIGEIVLRKKKLDFIIELPAGKGKTIRMKNLLFWQLFYSNLLDERLAAAVRIRNAIYKKKSAEYLQSEKIQAAIVQKTTDRINKKDRIDLLGMELMSSDIKKRGKLRIESDYLISEGRAVLHLCAKFLHRLEKSDSTGCSDIIDTLSYTAFKIDGLFYLKSLCELRFRKDIPFIPKKPAKRFFSCKRKDVITSAQFGELRRLAGQVAEKGTGADAEVTHEIINAIEGIKRQVEQTIAPYYGKKIEFKINSPLFNRYFINLYYTKIIFYYYNRTAEFMAKWHVKSDLLLRIIRRLLLEFTYRLFIKKPGA